MASAMFFAQPKPDDRHWRKLTQQANAFYKTGDMVSAQSLYHAALAEAERLFDQSAGAEMAASRPIIYNISCHNLAELALATADISDAEMHYRRAFEKLLEAARSPASPLCLRIACIQHLKHALTMLVQHLHVHNADGETVEAVICRAKDMALTVNRIAQAAARASLAHHGPPHA